MTTNIAAITPETHKNVKVRSDASVSFAEKLHIIPIVVNEFADAAANFPIVFVKDEKSDRFRVCAMMGLEVEKNLFYQGGNWAGTHVPMNIGRQPFAFAPLGDGQSMGAAIDMNSDLVSETEGTALFDNEGNQTEYFQRANAFLAQLFEGEVATQRFSDAIKKHDLLRDFRLIMEDETGTKAELVGLQTISAEQLQALSDEAITEMQKEGFLAAAHIAIQSMAQIKRLVKMNNEQGGRHIRSIKLEMVGGAQAAA